MSRYRFREGHLDAPRDHEEEGEALGEWLFEMKHRGQRHTRQGSDMLPGAWRTSLEFVPGWRWAGPPDRIRPPISGAEMSTREEAELAYPGSVLVHEQLVYEDEGHGFDSLDATALVTRWRNVKADPDEVLAWFREQLLARGWNSSGRSAGGLMHTYLRDIRREQLSVIIRKPGYAMWVPPGGFPRSGTTAYSVSYTAHSKRE